MPANPPLDEPGDPDPADDPDDDTRGGEDPPEALPVPGIAPPVADEPVGPDPVDDPDDDTRGGEDPPEALLVPGIAPSVADEPVDPDPADDTRGGAGASASPDPTRTGAPAAPRLPDAPGAAARDSFLDAGATASAPWLRAVTAKPLPTSPARPPFLPVTWVVRRSSGAGSLPAFPPLTLTGAGEPPAL